MAAQPSVALLERLRGPYLFSFVPLAPLLPRLPDLSLWEDREDLSALKPFGPYLCPIIRFFVVIKGNPLSTGLLGGNVSMLI